MSCGKHKKCAKQLPEPAPYQQIIAPGQHNNMPAKGFRNSVPCVAAEFVRVHAEHPRRTSQHQLPVSVLRNKKDKLHSCCSALRLAHCFTLVDGSTWYIVAHHGRHCEKAGTHDSSIDKKKKNEWISTHHNIDHLS